MILAGVMFLSLSVLGQQAAAQGKYKFRGELSADECFRECGDQVAIPFNDEDARAIQNLIPQQTRVWVGITKNRGQRFWNVGTSEDRFNGPFRWGPNEGDDDEPRAAAIFNSAAFREGKWYDMPNDGRTHFCVCEAARWPGAGVCASCAPRPGCRFPDATCESCGQPVCDVILAPVRPGCPSGTRVVRDAGECQRANRALGLGLRYRGTIFANDEPARCYFNRELNFVRWNGRTTSRAAPANRELLCIPTEQAPVPAPVPAPVSTPRPASSPTSALDVILADVRSGCPSGRRVVESAGECQRANRALGLGLRYAGTIFANDQPARCYLHGELNFVRWNGRTNSRASPPDHQILCILADRTSMPAPTPAPQPTPSPASVVFLADVRSGCPSGRRVVESAGECQRANRALGLGLPYRGTIFANDEPARCYLHGELNFVRWNGRTTSRASPPNRQILCVPTDC